MGWRTESNQDVQELVCNMSWSLGSEYKQQYTYITFQEYSSDGTINSPGFILCLAVCAAWSLAVLKVVGEIMDQLRAVWKLANSECAIMEITVTDAGFMLQRLPVLRYVLFLLMCCVQVVIAGALLLAGLQWLASTTDIVELLLNGVALAYIMEIGELTYQVLAPTKVTTLIRRMQPLRVDWPMALPVRSMLLVVPLMIIMALVTFVLITPTLNGVVAVQQALCP